MGNQKRFAAVALLSTLILGALLVVNVAAARAASSWRTQVLGTRGADWAWSPDGAAWRAPSGDEGAGTIVTWDASRDTTDVLCVTKPADYDHEVTWHRGRVYWLRSNGDEGFAILSMAPGERRPAVVLKRSSESESLFQMAGDRMIWSEWLPGKTEWAVYTMRLSDRKPALVQRFSGSESDDFSSADVRLSSHALCWAELGSDQTVGMRTVCVLPIDESGDLQAKVELDAGGSYLFDSLRVDGARLVWAVQEDGQAVFTWKVGETQPHEIPDPILFDGATRVGYTAVSGDRVAWSDDTRDSSGSFRSTIRMWAAGESVATTLASSPSRPDGPVVSGPVISGDRIAWVVIRRGDNIDDAESDDVPVSKSAGAVITWRVGDDRPTVVVEHLPIRTEDPKISVSDDRIAFWIESEFEVEGVHLARLKTPQHPAASDTTVATTMSAAVETQSVSRAPSKRTGAPVKDLVVGLTAVVVGILALVTWRKWAQRRGTE